MKTTKAEMALRALLMGNRVVIDGATYMWADDRLCMICQRYPAGTPDACEEVLLPVDYSFTGFVRECEKMTEEDYVCLGFANAMLNMPNRREAYAAGR